MGGGASTGLFGRKRLHGGEDESEALCYVLVWCTGQSWGVAFGVSIREKQNLRSFWCYREIRSFLIVAYLLHLPP